MISIPLFSRTEPPVGAETEDQLRRGRGALLFGRLDGEIGWGDHRIGRSLDDAERFIAQIMGIEWGIEAT